MTFLFRALLVLSLMLHAASACAHESLPVYLGLTETMPGTFQVLWRVPAMQGPPPTVAPTFPSQCESAAHDISPSAGSFVGRWLLKCDAAGLSHGTVGVAGLEHTALDALVRIDLLNGREITTVLKPSMPRMDLADAHAAVDVWGYFGLGVEHILLGIDHLLFVLGLVLIVRQPWARAKTVTAFTLAHSITLAAASLGLVHVPSAPVEATIALSIVFLARELIRFKRGDAGVTARLPWVVAFSFGLLHGFGFAGALADIGLPENNIPLALLLFNLGVEAGQLLFVAALLLISAVLRSVRATLPERAANLPAYSIGAGAAFWLIERMVLIINARIN